MLYERNSWCNICYLMSVKPHSQTMARKNLLSLRYMMTSSNGNISALLSICAGNSPVTDLFPAQRPVTRSFDVFFDLRLNKQLNKQWQGWWFETPSRPLWRPCKETTIYVFDANYQYTYQSSLIPITQLSNNMSFKTISNKWCREKWLSWCHGFLRQQIPVFFILARDMWGWFIW